MACDDRIEVPLPFIMGLVLIALPSLAGRAPGAEKARELETNPSEKPRPFLMQTDDIFKSDILRNGGLFVTAAAVNNKGGKERARRWLSELKHRPRVTKGFCTEVDIVGAVRYWLPVVDEFYFDVAATPWFSNEVGYDVSKATLWPGYSNPFVDRIRAIRETAGSSAAFYAGVYLRHRWIWQVSGERMKRGVKFEEARWLCLAVIGSDYQGIIWRKEDKHRTGLLAKRLSRFQEQVMVYAEDLGVASPVKWLEPSPDQPATVLLAKKRLFLVLLNPDYMAMDYQDKNVPLPVTETPRQGTVIIRPGGGWTIGSAVNLAANPVPIRRVEGKFHVHYRYHGGGDMVAIDVTETGQHSQRDSSGPLPKKPYVDLVGVPER